MGIEISIWLIILIIGLLAYFFSFVFKTPHVFVLGCALLIGSGALLWGFNGLITGYYYAETAGELIYTAQVVSMENVGLVMLSLFLIAVPILSALIIDFGGMVKKKGNVYHY